MSHVGAGASGHMKTNSSHPSSVKLLSVKEAQDAYNNVQASMAAAQHAGNATRASIQSLRAKLKASLGQLQQVAAAENYDKAVWSPVSVSNGKDEHQHVYSILDVLEYVMSGQWPASIQLRHVDSSEQRQLSDLVSEQSWSLVTAALSVQQELNALHKQESAHLCKVRQLVLLTQACEARLYAAQAGEGRWQVISRAGLSPLIPLSKLLRQLEEGKLRSKDLVQAEQTRAQSAQPVTRTSLGELSECIKALLKFAKARATHAAEHAASPLLADQLLAQLEGGSSAGSLPGGKPTWGPETQCWVWEFANSAGPAGLPVMASTQAYSVQDLQMWINQGTFNPLSMIHHRSSPAKHVLMQDVLDHLSDRQRQHHHYEKQQRAAQLYVSCTQQQQQQQEQQQHQQQQQPPQQLAPATNKGGHQEVNAIFQPQWSTDLEQEALRLVREGLLKHLKSSIPNMLWASSHGGESVVARLLQDWSVVAAERYKEQQEALRLRQQQQQEQEVEMELDDGTALEAGPAPAMTHAADSQRTFSMVDSLSSRSAQPPPPLQLPQLVNQDAASGAAALPPPPPSLRRPGAPVTPASTAAVEELLTRQAQTPAAAAGTTPGGSRPAPGKVTKHSLALHGDMCHKLALELVGMAVETSLSQQQGKAAEKPVKDEGQGRVSKGSTATASAAAAAEPRASKHEASDVQAFNGSQEDKQKGKRKAAKPEREAEGQEHVHAASERQAGAGEQRKASGRQRKASRWDSEVVKDQGTKDMVQAKGQAQQTAGSMTNDPQASDGSPATSTAILDVSAANEAQPVTTIELPAPAAPSQTAAQQQQEDMRRAAATGHSGAKQSAPASDVQQKRKTQKRTADGQDAIHHEPSKLQRRAGADRPAAIHKQSGAAKQTAKLKKPADTASQPLEKDTDGQDAAELQPPAPGGAAAPVSHLPEQTAAPVLAAAPAMDVPPVDHNGHSKPEGPGKVTAAAGPPSPSGDIQDMRKAGAQEREAVASLQRLGSGPASPRMLSQGSGALEALLLVTSPGRQPLQEAEQISSGEAGALPAQLPGTAAGVQQQVHGATLAPASQHQPGGRPELQVSVPSPTQGAPSGLTSPADSEEEDELPLQARLQARKSQRSPTGKSPTGGKAKAVKLATIAATAAGTANAGTVPVQEDASDQQQDAALTAATGAGSTADNKQAAAPRGKKRARGGSTASAAGRAGMPAGSTDAKTAFDIGAYTWPAKRMAARAPEAKGTKHSGSTVPPGSATCARLLRLDLVRKGGARPPPALGPGSPRRGRKRQSDNTEGVAAGAGPSGQVSSAADEGRASGGAALAGGQKAGGGTTRASRKERLDLIRSTAALTGNSGSVPSGSGAGAAGPGAGGAGAGVGGEGGLLALEAAKWRNITAHTKLLKFGRSKIQGWGMYATAPIMPDEFVIEYVGEEVRCVLADARERLYQALGLDDYMFRVDEEVIVDATRKGGAARFINHSCDPNCYTKIFTVEGSKHIGIYAKRRIEVGEELNYDYKFQEETDPARKVPCNCGARNCRRWMC